MTRGSVVVFTCILSVRWLKQKLRPHHYVAVAVVCAAVALVGVAGRFGEKGHTSLASYVLGLGLIVVGQAVGALQFCSGLCGNQISGVPRGVVPMTVR
jgi:drug/metabolite transporter (DMT)-like permease